jgi:hypothetical protein
MSDTTMQRGDREHPVRLVRAMSRLRYAMGDSDGTPIERLAAAMAELQVATARRRLLPRDSAAYEDAVTEEMRVNDRIMELAAKRNLTPLSKARSAAQIQAELIACGVQFSKTQEGPAREALAAWVEALRDELIRARAIEDRDKPPP